MGTNEDQLKTEGASAPPQRSQGPASQVRTIPDWQGGRVGPPGMPVTDAGGATPSKEGAAVSPSATQADRRVATPPGTAEPTAALAANRSVPAPALVGGRIREFIWLSAAVVDAFLALDFLFRAVGFAGGGFVSVVATVGGALGSPFGGIVRGAASPTVGHTADWPVLVAIVVYTAAAWIAARMCLVLLGQARPAARF